MDETALNSGHPGNSIPVIARIFRLITLKSLRFLLTEIF